MKKIIKVIGILLVSAFILLPLKTNAQEPVWSQSLDLNDSVSSAIVKVEDGIVVMQYEGVASASNLLIKYDFNGKKIWEIDNDYGYNIESVSDGFIVWNDKKITKFDKDKNIIWKIEDGSSRYYSNLIEVEDGYIVYGSGIFYKIDKTGNIIKSIIDRDIFLPFGIDRCDAIADKMTTENEVLMFAYSSDEATSTNTIKIMHFNSNLELTEKKEQIIHMNKDKFYRLVGDSVNMGNIIQTDNGYIITGVKTLLFDKNAKLVKSYNKIITDMEKIGDYLYGYVIREDAIGYYNTFLIKYDQELNEISSTPLELSFSTQYGFDTSFSRIKNRTVYQYDENNIDSIVLNTPTFAIFGTQNLKYDTSYNNSGKYSLTKYRLTEENKAQDNTSGIINSIIKNPQTNSILIIALFMILILAISIGSYFIYKKQIKR